MSTPTTDHYRTLVPGDRKIPVTITAEFDAGPLAGTRDVFARYAEPMAYDEEHQTASRMAADALLNLPDEHLADWLRFCRDEVGADAGLVTVKVGGRVLYETTPDEILATLQRYEETPCPGDWPVGFGF